MSARDLVMAAAGSAGDSNLYSDDVFSAYTYTGNGSTQTINNGIDLAGKGGMVWIKARSNTSGYGHLLFNTNSGTLQVMKSHKTYAQASEPNSLTAFNANGFSLGSSVVGNTAGATFVAWAFRKAPKFFDVVTYTGNGSTSSRLISHSLGIKPGFLIIKRTDAISDWIVFARNTSGNFALFGASAGTGLQSTASAGFPDSAAVSGFLTSSTFDCVCPGGYLAVAPNVNGATYVAYLFAHDTSTDGIIQCGSFTPDGSGNATVNLGWEPQYLMVKASSTTSQWYVVDQMRGFGHSGTPALYPNLSNAEATEFLANGLVPTATGFQVNGQLSAGQTYIYLAIRRPNKPPTVGTQVYNHVARTATGAAATITGIGFAPDVVLSSSRVGYGHGMYDKLRGVHKTLYVSSTASEQSEQSDTGTVTSFDQDGIAIGSDDHIGLLNLNGTYITRLFKRAPKFLDVVLYAGTGSPMTVPHNLQDVPALMFVRRRGAASDWYTCAQPIGGTEYMLLNSTSRSLVASTPWNNTTPTSSVFTVGSTSVTNASGASHIAYVWANCPGVSNIGLYTGNGSSQTINCGFSTGARFILIKRTDSDGDWYVWDTARGIVSANDPHLSLNTAAAEVTSNDSVDPDSTGFIVNQVAATNINVSAATYLYLAIA